MRIISCVATFLILSAPLALADVGDLIKDDGTTNPEEMTLNYFANTYKFKGGKSTACIYGYTATKSGNHDAAKKIFDKCIAAESDASMIWMSYLYENGFGVEQNPDKATEWSRKAAKRGYSIGEYNYGLSLLRGHGVKRDEEAGKRWIGQAAKRGDDAARTLIDSGYDLDVAIPDADQKFFW